MVVIESMASGTPVVGTRDGALPELIHNDTVGRLFDPGPANGAEPVNAPGLAQALLECLELSRRPETALRCRERAEEFGWDRIGPVFEDLYERLAAGARRPSEAA